MILYDQDFRFIGMSAETLTFLGYEDIDEFTSMHSDFSDLFVKKEGYVHKFENFSWIHYVLYSGAANKKAYVSRKNGEEVCVDITIKEVFLNHTYDGLRTIYSVKLINENFTKISQSDVHDNRSAISGKSQFSLNSLTKDLNLPEEPVVKEEPVVAPTGTTTVPEPLDFKLDIPDTSIFATPETKTSEPAPQKPEINVPLFDAPDVTAPVSDEPKEETKTEEPTFTLNFPEPETATTEEQPPAVHIDFGTPDVKNEEVETTSAPQPTEQTLSETFKLNFPTPEEPEETPVKLNFDLPLAKEDTTETAEKEPQAEPQTVQIHETVTEREPEHKDIFSFQLLKEQHKTSSETAQTENAETAAPQRDETLLKLHEPEKTVPAHAVEASVETLTEESTETVQPEEKKNIFNFNFLQNSAAQSETQEEQKEEKEVEAPQAVTPEVTIPLSDLLKPESTVHETTHEEKNATAQFSFNLFKEEPEEENNESFLSTRAEETKSTLIDQIKHDIEVIDQDVQIEPSEQEDAGQKLESLLHESMQEQKQEFPQSKETAVPETKQPKPFTFDYQPAETTDNNTQGIEIAVKPDFPEEITQHEENTFEETLKNIFSTEQNSPQPEEPALNNIEPQKPVQETKQSVTTEAIKSPDQNEAPSPEALVLPKLGSLGLSREEELDFIEEFLDDTAATVGLMQEYLKLEDYSNIKYNLIKIASSAEILHFDQMLAHTRELTALCDAAQKEGVAEKLQKLLQLAKRYKEHFSSMPV